MVECQSSGPVPGLPELVRSRPRTRELPELVRSRNSCRTLSAHTSSNIIPDRNVILVRFARISGSGDRNRKFLPEITTKVTTDGYFRLVTTLIGMCITDAWKGYTYHLGVNHQHKNMKILDFANMLSRDMMDNDFSKIPESERAMCIDVRSTASSETNEEAASRMIKTISTLDKATVASALTDLSASPTAYASPPSNVNDLRSVLGKHKLSVTNNYVKCSYTNRVTGN